MGKVEREAENRLFRKRRSLQQLDEEPLVYFGTILLLYVHETDGSPRLSNLSEF
jgi:hypothetical protein